jgi:signal transduction histidine kinase
VALRLARPAALALVVVLSVTARQTIESWWWLPGLVVVGIVAGLLDRLNRPPGRTAIEMGGAAGVIGLAWDDSFVALPYLLLPGFAAGLARGVLGALGGTAIAAAALALATAPGYTVSEWVSAEVDFLPWVVLVLAVGLIGAWARRQRSEEDADRDRYAAAYRLLSELRLLSRRLSVGLDPIPLAASILEDSVRLAPGRRAALLSRSEGGVLIPLARAGSDDDSWLNGVERDPTFVEAWTSESVTVSRAADARRVVVPLRVATRTIGAVVIDGDLPVRDIPTARLAEIAETGALRLETALLFDEVRDIATREERQRLAREIHDGIAQELASLGYLADDIGAAESLELARSHAADLRAQLSRLVSELRLSIFDLRADVTPDAGLGAAIADHARRVGSTSGLTVHLVIEETTLRLRHELEAELLRIAQEAITNARKHSGARNLWVDVLVAPPRAIITIGDDGRGLGSGREDSFGLKIMAERARHIRADLSVDSRPGGGTVVRVILGEGADADDGNGAVGR